MYPWRLCLLANQAVRYLRMYGPIDASVAVSALGELDYDLSTSSSSLLLSLAPFLPHYDSTQLTRVFAGLSRLRVAHYMITSYILKLFLAALARGGGGAKTLTWTVHSGCPVRRAAADQLVAVAGMVCVVQMHHTQRTVRAFLAAAERALAPIMTSGEGACSTSARHVEKGDDISSTPPASARRMALQVLFILEVYVNARVRVAAPYTPVWLRHMISHAPWTSFSLSELLHVYSRLFPATATRWPAGCVAGGSAACVMQQSLTEHILDRAGDPELVDRRSCRSAPPVAVAQDAGEASWLSKSDFADAAQTRCRAWTRLPPGEQYALLRCVVWRLALQPLRRARSGEADELLGFLTPALFCRLSAEFGGQMRGPALRLWMGVLPRSSIEKSHMANATESRALGEGAFGETVQLCVTLLQLLHIQYAAAGEEAGSFTCSAVACHTDDSADTTQGGEVVVAVQRLVACLRTVASLVRDHAWHEGEWELLALLLDMHFPSAYNTTGVSFAQWLDAALQQSGGAVHMWRCLSAVQQGARDALMARWCGFWAHRRGVMESKNPMTKELRSATLIHASERDSATPLFVGLAEDEWRLHWFIANLVDEWLQRSSQDRRLRRCAKSPLAHLTPRQFSFLQLWQEMLAETMIHLRDSGRGVAARGLPYLATDLETDLLAIMAESLDPSRTARARTKGAQSLLCLVSLARAISDSALPEVLCAALERTKRHSIDAPGRTLLSYAEAEVHRERWRRRVWWSASASVPGTSVWLPAAQVLLLCALFHPSEDYATCSAASVASPWWWSARWPYGMLAVCLRISAMPQQPSATCHKPLESCGNEWRAHGPQWEIQDAAHAGAEYHALGPLSHFGAVNLTEPPPAQISLFACAKGLSNALMCSIEALVAWQRRSGVLAADTLRGRGEDRTLLPPDVSGASATLYRVWYRDDTPVILAGSAFSTVKPFEDHSIGLTASDFAESLPGPPSAQGADALVPLCETVALLTRAAVPLNTSGASLFALSPTLSSACSASCNERAAPSSLRAPLSRFQPLMTAEALYAELCLCFWEHCRRLAQALLALCVASKPDSRDDDEWTASFTAAEALAIAGATEWRRFSRCVSDASPSAKPSCDAYGLTAAQSRATELLLPLIWRRVHSCAAEPSPATSRMRKSHQPIRRVLSDVWRLQLFANHFCGQLPLPVKCEPAQKRLWWCLQAALTDAISAGEQGSLSGEPAEALADQAALELAVSHLRTSLCQRHWFDTTTQGTQRPLFFLRGTICAVCTGLGAALASSGDGDSSMTSPMETYVQRLLPCHPFVFAGARGMPACLLCGVRLVVLTWMHVLLLEGIVVYHPRLLSVRCTQQLTWVRSHLRAYEQRLYMGISPTAPLCSEGVSHSMALSTGAEKRRHGLLAKCLVRELDAAVCELIAWSRDPCTPAR
ncbi:hypothetical protein GH5_04567 [Leishmania sp. Ghana 2012 LV757]|uniref:hypothetical protein n=1 Tax=Leishmania sp. Ghana 2012 LV757 TaxID=2803181 RepID=UPI001B3F1F74|nr:hypothetical protein GH5_04567 [Leishmania sp. Ghana 2012 LV757]